MPDNEKNNGQQVSPEFVNFLTGMGTATRKMEQIDEAFKSGDNKSYLSELGEPYRATASRYLTQDELDKVNLIRKKYGYSVKAEDNINEILAYSQSRADKLANGIVKLAGVAGTTFAESFSSIFHGIPSAVVHGDISKVWDNELSNTYDQFNEHLRNNVAPHYYTEDYSSQSNFERMQSMNFWADTFGNGMGTVLGAIGAGAVIKGLNAGTAISRFKKGSDVYKNVKTGIQAADKLDDTARAAKRASYIDNLLIGSAAAAGESGVEARGIKNSVVEKLKELRDKGDPRYVNLTDEDIEKMATSAGNVGFALNFATVGTTSFLTFGKLLRSSWDIERKAASKVVKQLGKEGYESAGLSAKDKVFAYGSSILAEPFQEGMQFAYEKGITDFFNSYNSDNSAFKNITDASIHGLSETLGTVEGRESIILGALLGGPMGVFQTSPELGQEAAQNVAVAELFNRIKSSEIKPLIDAVRQFGSYQAAMDNAAITGDKFNYQNAKFGQAFSYIQSRIEAGRLDILEEELDELGKSMSKEEFEQVFSEPGKNVTPQQAVQSIKEKIKSIKEISDKVELAFPTLDYEQKLPLKYAFNVVKDVDKRISELSSKHLNPKINSSNKGLFKSMLDLIKSNKEISEDLLGFEPKIEESTVSLYFQGLSQTLKENKHLREETIQDLEDLIKLEERREQYIQDIQDMSTLEGIEKKEREAYLKRKQEEKKKKNTFSIRGKKLSDVDTHIQSQVGLAKRKNVFDLQKRIADKSVFWNAVEEGDFEKMSKALSDGMFTLESDEIEQAESTIQSAKDRVQESKDFLKESLEYDEYGDVTFKRDFTNQEEMVPVMEAFEMLGVDSTELTADNIAQRIDALELEETDIEKKISDVEASLEKMKSVREVTKDPSFESLREDFFRTYVNSAYQLTDTIEDNEEYDDESSVDETIEDLKSLQSVLKEANEENTPYKNELISDIDFLLEEFKKLKTIINQRKLNKELKQKRILKRYAKGLFTSLGVNTSNGELNELGTIIRDIFEESKEGEFDTIIEKAKADDWNAAYGEILLGKLSKYLIKNDEGKKLISEHRKKITTAHKKKMISIGFSKLLPEYWDNPVKFAAKPIERYLTDYHTENKTYPAKFVDNMDFDEFVHAYESKSESFIDPDKVLNDENIKTFIDIHSELIALSNLETMINSDYKIEEQIQKEITMLEKLGKDQTPTFQQLTAIRETLKYIGQSSNGGLFEDLIYLRGSAGTGKTRFVLSWVIRLLGIKLSDLYVTGHNANSSETANLAVNKKDKTSIDELNELLANNKFTGKLIVVDEIGGLDRKQLLTLATNLSNFNKQQIADGKRPVKMFTLGDPNQMTSGDTLFAPIEHMSETESTSIKMVSPLTIKYRSDVRQIIDFQEMFINNKNDLTETEIVAKTNVANASGEVLGVRGTNNFIVDTIQFIKEQKASGQNKTRVIITNKDPKRIQEYKDKLNAAGITDVEVLDYVEVQGRTVDQVFVDVRKSNKEFRDNQNYNKALYTATSRAVNFIMMGNMVIKNMVDDSVKESKNISEEQKEIKFENVKEELNKQLEIVKEFYEIKTKTKSKTKTTTEESKESKESEETEKEEVPENEPDGSTTEEEVIEKTEDIEDTLSVDEEGVSDGIVHENIVEINDDYEDTDHSEFEDIEDGNNIDDFNDNTVSGEGTSHKLTYPTRRGLVDYEIGEDGVKRVVQVVQPGMSFVVVKRKSNNDSGFVISAMVGFGNGLYKEVGVFSSEEMDNLFTPEEKQKMLSGNITVFSSTKSNPGYFKSKGKMNIFKDGIISEATPLTYIYDFKNPKPFSLNGLLQKVVNKFKQTSGITDDQVNSILSSAKIKVFKKSELKTIAQKNSDGFVPKEGIPYLVIDGKGNFANQYIRLAPAKLNINNHSHLVEPLIKLQKASKALSNVLGTFGINEQLGDEFFGHLVTSIGRNHRVTPEIALNNLVYSKTNKYPSISISKKIKVDGYKDPVSIVDLADEIHSLVFGEVSAPLSSIKEGSYVYITNDNGERVLKEVVDVKEEYVYDVDEDGSEIEITQKFVYTRKGLNTLDKNLITDVEPVSFEAHGPAQVALNTLSKSNKEVDGMSFSVIKKMKKAVKFGEKYIRPKFISPGVPNGDETLRYGKQIITRDSKNIYETANPGTLYRRERVIEGIISYEKRRVKEDPNFEPLKQYSPEEIQKRYDSKEYADIKKQLLDGLGQPFNQNMLDALLSFDEQGNSTANGGFGIRVPISKTSTVINGKSVSYNDKYVPVPEVDSIMFEDILEDVIPTSVSVSFNSGVKSAEATNESATTESSVKAKDLEINLSEFMEDEDPFKSYEFGEEELSDLGEMSKGGVRAYIEKRIPGIKPYQIQFLSKLEMMRFRNKEDWGVVKDGVIYLAENEDGTFFRRVVRHEVFHKIFRSYLNSNERSNLYSELSKKYPQTKGMTHLQKEEFLANLYETWEIDRKNSPSTLIGEFFRMLKKLFNLIRSKPNTIEDIFERIESGQFKTESKEPMGSTATYINIKDTFETAAVYKAAKKFFLTALSKRTKLSSNAEDFAVQDPNTGAWDNLTFSRDEAIKYIKENYIPRVLAEVEKTGSKGNLYKALHKLSNDKIFFKFLKDLYPNITIGNDGVIEINDEELDFDFELSDSENPYGVENDRINHEKKLSTQVKDFLSTIEFTYNGVKYPLNPRLGFVKLVELMDNINPENSEMSELEQLDNVFLSLNKNPYNTAVYETLVELFETATLTTDANGKPFPKDTMFSYERTKRKDSSLTFTHKGESIYRENFDNHLSFLEAADKMSNLGIPMVNELYKKAMAADTLNAIYNNANSLRKKDVMIGISEYKFDFKTIEQQVLDAEMQAMEAMNNPQSNKRQEDDSNGFHYRYVRLYARTSHVVTNSHIKNAFVDQYEKILKLKHLFLSKENKKLKKAESLRTLLVALNMIDKKKSDEELDVIDNADSTLITDVYDDVVQIISVLEEIQKKINSIDPSKNLEYVRKAIYEQIKNNTGRIQRLQSLVEPLSAHLERSTNYRGGDGFVRWLYEQSSQAYDIVNNFMKGDKKLLPEHVKNSKLYSYNILSNGFSTIKRFVDHDSMKQKNGDFVTHYSNENSRNWLLRNVFYQFNSGMSQVSEDLTYIQSFNTISNKPKAAGVELPILNQNGLRKAILNGLWQDVIRSKSEETDKNFVKNKNKSQWLLDQKDFPTEEILKDPKKADELVEKVMAKLEQMSINAAQKFVKMRVPVDGRLANINKRLISFYSESFKDNNKLLDQYDTSKIEGELRNRAKSANYSITVEEILPYMDLFVKNFYVNNLFLNQLVVGDEAYFKNSYDEIKRMSIAFGQGSKGRVDNQTGLRKKFLVSVFGDVESTLSKELIEMFPALKGGSSIDTDGQGFCTPRRANNIRKGFGRDSNLSSTMKPVYYSLDKNGKPVALKYSLIELTDELCEMFPDLANLRFNLDFNGITENRERARQLFDKSLAGTLTKQESAELRSFEQKAVPIDEAVFTSAVKVGAPVITSSYNNGKFEIDSNSIMELDNNNFRMQLNPRSKLNKMVKKPSQLLYFFNSYLTNNDEDSRLEELMGKIIRLKRSDLDETLSASNSKLLRANVRKMLKSSSVKNDSDQRVVDFLSTKGISMNNPVIANKVISQFASIVDKNTVDFKFNGAKLVLQSSTGTNIKGKDPQLVFDKATNKYYMEVYMPDLYQKELTLDDKGYLKLDSEQAKKFNKFLGFRIPSTEIHSAVPIKVIGFYPSKSGQENIIIAPKELVFLHGSDFDIDTLSVIRKSASKYKIIDNNGNEIVKKGELFLDTHEQSLKNELTVLNKQLEAKEREIEELKKSDVKVEPSTLDNKNNELSLLKSKKTIVFNALTSVYTNQIVDILHDTLADKKNWDMMMKPITMDKFSGTFESEESVFDMIYKIRYENHEDYKPKPVREEGEPDNVYETKLKDWKNYRDSMIREQRNLNNPIDQMKMKSDNTSGTILTGIFANAAKNFNYLMKANTAEDRLDVDSVVKFSKDLAFKIGDNEYTGITRKDKDGNWIWDTIDSMINAAIDNVKEQILEVINANANTANIFTAMIGSGVPVNTAVKLMITPTMLEFSESNSKNSFNESNTAKDTIKDKMKELARTELGVEDTSDNANAFQKYLQSLTLTEEGLDKLLAANLSSISDLEGNPELAKIQLAAYAQLIKINKIGENLFEMSQFLSIVKELPNTFEDAQDKLDYLDTVYERDEVGENDKLSNEGFVITKKANEYKLKKSFIFPDVQLFTVPIIKESYESLKWFKSKSENILFKHNKNLQLFASAFVKSQFNPNIDKYKNTNLSKIREEFIKYLSSGIAFDVYKKPVKKENGEVEKQAGYSVNFDTTSEEPYTKVVNGKDYTATVYGNEAWKQRFIERVLTLKQSIKKNQFLDRIEIKINDETGLYYLTFPAVSSLEQADRLELEEAFEKLNNNSEEYYYTNVQYDFLKYAILFEGGQYSMSNLSTVLPPELYVSYDIELNRQLVELFNAKGEDIGEQNSKKGKRYLNPKLKNVVENFGLQLAINFGENIFNIKERKNRDKVISIVGEHVDNQNKKRSNISEIETENGTIRAFYDIALKTKTKSDLYITDGKKVFYKVYENEGIEDNKKIYNSYYQFVGYISDKGSYQFSPELFENSYSVKKAFDIERGNLGTKDHLPEKQSLTKTIKAVTYYQQLFTTKPGDKVTIFRYSDVIKRNALPYIVESVSKPYITEDATEEKKKSNPGVVFPKVEQVDITLRLDVDALFETYENEAPEDKKISKKFQINSPSDLADALKEDFVETIKRIKDC